MSAIFSHNGNVISDSLDESAFIALNISITTNLSFFSTYPTASWGEVTSAKSVAHIDKEIVDADLAISDVNIEHPSSGNSVAQRWK